MIPMSPEENVLQRYAYWAFKLYRDFVDARNRNGFDADAWMYLSIWLGLLYVSVEGWRRLKLRDAKITLLLKNEDNVRRLKFYRHGVFHFQKRYWNKLFAKMTDKPETAQWAEALTMAFSDYFARRAIETNHPALKQSRKR